MNRTESARHRTCQHLIYSLSCNEFDSLVERAGGCCEICGRQEMREQQDSRLGIDHDHSVGSGVEGVRGLLCPKCNAHMRRVDSGERPVDERVSRYLATAFHLALDPSDLRIRSMAKERVSTMRCVRVSDEAWGKAAAAAALEGETITAAVIRLLTWYGDNNDPTRRPTEAPFSPAPGWTLTRTEEDREK